MRKLARVSVHCTLILLVFASFCATLWTPATAQMPGGRERRRESSDLPLTWSAADVCVPEPERAFQGRLYLDAWWDDDPSGRQSPSAPLNTFARATLPVLRANIPPDSAMLVTFSALDGGCSWLITNAGIVAYGRTSRTIAEARSDVEALMVAIDVTQTAGARSPRRDFETAPPTPTTTLSADALLQRLAQTIAPGPVLHALGGVTKLISASSQPYYTFPFALLPLENGAPLLAHATLQMTPSVNYFAWGFGRNRNTLVDLSPAQRRTALRKSLVIGNPRFADRIYTVVPPLPDAEREARTIGQMFGARPLLGREATLDAMVRATTRQAPPYIHLATHGTGSADDSFVMLADGDRLYAAGSLSLEHHPVVVLSACQTGLGRLRDGGVVNLAGKLHRAGASAVVISLWSVDDDATLLLMTEFAKGMLDSGQPSIALAAAMRATRSVYPEPRAWAAFTVLTGEPL